MLPEAGGDPGLSEACRLATLLCHRPMAAVEIILEDRVAICAAAGLHAGFIPREEAMCAPLLRPYARHLTGVDLSPKMADKARERGGYDELVVAELTAFLRERSRAYDLIVSADTLVYFGDLTALCAGAAGAVRPGGWLAFTVERAERETAPEGYRLNKSGRYSHTAEHLARALVAAGFDEPSLAEVTLRQEGDQPVLGYAVLVRQPNFVQGG